MKPTLSLILIFLFIFGSCSRLSRSPASESSVQAMFSPQQGQQAFDIIYQSIADAQKSVRIVLYSWSDSKLKQAFLTALENKVSVKIILHPSLAKKSRLKKTINDLELAGAVIKVAPFNMHEKFLLVDDHFLLNSSANMSRGAKTKYSENFIFMKKNLSINQALFTSLYREFAIIWNSSKDIFTHDEDISLKIPLPDDKINDISLQFFSSSMNFTPSPTGPDSKYRKKGIYTRLRRNGGTKNQTWIIRDMIINHINNAKSSVYLSLNHFNIRDISDSLIQAVKRGVDVKLFVDNQEFRSRPNNREMTPQFVKDWKSLSGNKDLDPPVRVKYYSHSPSPLHWFLNHHKFILIDSSSIGSEKLISGSYNLSKTAEHKQFDNMVLFQGSHFTSLHQDFLLEFTSLWKLGRNDQDLPLQSLLSYYTSLKHDSLPIHSKSPMSLTWREVISLRRDVANTAKGFFKLLYKNRDCLFFNVKTSSYHGCPNH